MLFWRTHNAGEEAREKCRVHFRALMHRLLAYARLQVDDVTDVEMLLSGVMHRVAGPCSGKGGRFVAVHHVCYSA